MRKVTLPSARATCYCCLRPQAHCVCKLVKPFRLHCDLLILQHPRERRKYYATTKIIEPAIDNAHIFSGMRFTAQDLAPALRSGPTYLLFPGEDAQACGEINLDSNSTLVILDGTWSQARKMLRLSPVLQVLPKLSFSQNYVSRYRIRGQPASGCLSTVEALACFLLENSEQMSPGDAGERRREAAKLLSAFRTMVERQLACWESWRPLPHELASEEPLQQQLE